MDSRFSLLNVSNSFGHDITFKHDNADLTIVDWLEDFYTAMIGLTFNDGTILDGMIDFVSDKRGIDYASAENQEGDGPEQCVARMMNRVRITDTDSAEFHDLHSLAEEHYK